MSVLPKQEIDNVIKLSVIDGKIGKKKNIRYNKDGSIDKRHTNAVSGKSCEVYAFTTKEEIKSLIDLFNNRIENANNDYQRKIFCRNKMMFLIGINIGLRASDLTQLRYCFFLNEDMTFKDSYSLKPKKTKKTGKYVTLYFNQTVKKAIADYIAEYPIEDLNEYLFKSKKGDGAITERALWKIISNSAVEVGIRKNIGSHSLRKTWAYWIWHESMDKNKALVMLQQCFNHSSTITTMRYIGIMDEEKEELYNSIDLGLDYL